MTSDPGPQPATVPEPQGTPEPHAVARLRRPPPVLFLERQNYRYRRVMDAARLLPVFAAALVLVPMFWTAAQSTSSGLLYLFGIWLAAIGAAAVLSRRLLAPLRSSGRTGEE